MTTADYVHPTPGPIDLTIDVETAAIRIVPAQTGTAIATITTDAAGGPTYDAVRKATAVSEGNRLAITVPPRFPIADRAGALSGSHVNTGSGVYVAGNNYGVIETGAGSFVGGHAAFADDEITVTVEVPDGSDVAVTNTAGSIISKAVLRTVCVRTVSASVTLAKVDRVEVRTVAGDISIGAARIAELNSTSGSVQVGTVRDVTVHTVAGAVAVSDVRGDADLHTLSAPIDVGYSGPTAPRAHSLVGQVTARRVQPRAARA